MNFWMRGDLGSRFLGILPHVSASVAGGALSHHLTGKNTHSEGHLKHLQAGEMEHQSKEEVTLVFLATDMVISQFHWSRLYHTFFWGD